ncbi:MAG: T9SS type A sorting domain-containing protein [Bacteroidetes bacterium]|nr:T9SS type A sorting domain-containing protein [Bacteroidota bacterium]
MNIRVIAASAVALLILTSLYLLSFTGTRRKMLITDQSHDAYSNALKRHHWMLTRVVDPATGTIPADIRRLEIAYARTLPSDDMVKSGAKFDWLQRGPYKVGGRTRALAIDVANENVLIAGGVTGGLWRSVNGGLSWQRVITPDQHPGITCVVQDTRPGNQQTWYAGSGGEPWGNSASTGIYINYTANYLGMGVYKSTDSGLTWQIIDTTNSKTPQTTDEWDRIWKIAVSPRLDSDIVMVTTAGVVFRSNNGGNTWNKVLGKTGTKSMFTDIAVTDSGIFYVTMSNYTTGWNETGASFAGIWRSYDGLTWTQIKPSWVTSSTQYRRIVTGINPTDENEIYFLANTPGTGQMSPVFFGETEWNSLWKYTYLSGNGSGAGGLWEDLSSNIPANSVPFDNFNTQGSYDMVIAVKPDDPNVVFIGGTNLYRSDDAFTTGNNISQIGGYAPGSELPFYGLYPGQHPDQHIIAFLPSNPVVLLAGTDGGLYRTNNCLDSAVTWDSLNFGYITSQFYTVAIDHGANNSKVVIGGLQDNGSRWTNSESFTAEWTFPSEGDGSYCAIEDSGAYYYFSRQEGRVVKIQLDANGNRTAFKRMDPIGGRNYIFIAPMILDPSDNNIMYLAAGYELWRNNNLSSILLDNTWDSISDNWAVISSLPDTDYNFITAIACSRDNPPHRVYFGSNNDFASREIVRIDDAHSASPVETSFLIAVTGLGKYINCIAVDPRDGNKILVVFSNYNTYSLVYSDDGGSTWQKVAGNLESPQSPGPPTGLGLGTGPSLRSAAVIPVIDNRTVYLVGTSVGLFAADTLINENVSADSTLWVRQGTGSIGNAVIEMIDYRRTDGYTVIATHGNGIFSSYITDASMITAQKWSMQSKPVISAKIYPNPVQKEFFLEYDLPGEGNTLITIFDITGRELLSITGNNQQEGIHRATLQLPGSEPGIYYCEIRCSSLRSVVKFTKY